MTPPLFNFLRKGALAAAGAVCAGTGGILLAADTPSRIAQDFIAKYSDHFVIRSQEGGLTRLVARLRDLPSFAEALFGAKEAGISNLRCDRTIATFRAGGRAFEVENLMVEDFAAQNS